MMAGTEIALEFHRVSVDEDTSADGGTMFKAFCETCEWSAPFWHHAEDFVDGQVFEDSSGPDPASLASDQATRDGVEHTEGRDW